MPKPEGDKSLLGPNEIRFSVPIEKVVVTRRKIEVGMEGRVAEETEYEFDEADVERETLQEKLDDEDQRD